MISLHNEHGVAAMDTCGVGQFICLLPRFWRGKNKTEEKKTAKY
jgi:hypothetical protein